jgi:6-phosphogluconolactonase/glucosamine-6-phosphate isomerase/deaminase
MIALNSYPTREEAFAKAAEYLNVLFFDSQPQPILFLSSGGSALELVEYIREENILPDVTITVLDERYSRDPEENNFSRLAATRFFEIAQSKDCDFIDTRVADGESLEEFARRFEEGLRRWEEDNPNGVVIATMGIGADGHISGILPYPESKRTFDELFETEGRWVRGYDAGDEKNPYPERATTTMPFLRDYIDRAVVFATGQDKRRALDRIVAEDGALHETPGRILHEMPDVVVFTDQ